MDELTIEERRAIIADLRARAETGEISTELWVWRTILLCDWRPDITSAEETAFFELLKSCGAEELAAMWIVDHETATEFFVTCSRVVAGVEPSQAQRDAIAKAKARLN